jgi:hypothetical protein
VTSYYEFEYADYAAVASYSFMPLLDFKHFKMPESTDWKLLYSNDEFLDRLVFMYIAHFSLQSVHEGAVDKPT